MIGPAADERFIVGKLWRPEGLSSSRRRSLALPYGALLGDLGAIAGMIWLGTDAAIASMVDVVNFGLADVTCDVVETEVSQRPGDGNQVIAAGRTQVIDDARVSTDRGGSLFCPAKKERHRTFVNVERILPGCRLDEPQRRDTRRYTRRVGAECSSYTVACPWGLNSAPARLTGAPGPLHRAAKPWTLSSSSPICGRQP